MNPLVIALGLGGAGYGAFKVFSKPKASDFQTQSLIGQGGVPIKVLTPIPSNISPAQQSGRPDGPSHPAPKTAVPHSVHQATVYAPPKVITQTGPSQFSQAPIIVTPTGSSSVAIGSTLDVQHALNTLGFQPSLAEDGKLGPKTIANVRAFQAKNGLVVDGNAGPVTKAALSSALTGMASGGPAPAAMHAALASHPAYSSQSQTELGPYDIAPNKKPSSILSTGTAPTHTKPTYSPQSQTELGPYDTAPNRAGVSSGGGINSARDVQHALNLLGTSPALAEDGAIGPKSVAAIKSFQLSHGLTADGVAGPRTKAALAAAVGQPVTVAGQFAGSFG